MAAEPAQVERFGADLDLMLEPGAPIGVAVSGGPDSLALLILASAARPGLVAAATVDHALRPESMAEAGHVASICRRLGVPHAVLTLNWDEKPAGNVQARARDARYRALADWAARAGLSAVATAHHADDQAETLLMRIARGSGVGGLAGIQRSRSLGGSGAMLIRPLLGWRRAELEAIVASAGVAWLDDPSNRDDRFDRTRARALLAGSEWLDPHRLSVTAACCAAADEALDWVTAREFAARHRVIADGAMLLAVENLPDELARRLLLRALAEFDVGPTPGPQLAQAIAVLDAGGTTTLAGLKLSGGSEWRIERAPRRRS